MDFMVVCSRCANFRISSKRLSGICMVVFIWLTISHCMEKCQGIRGKECRRTSFLEKVAVRAGPFKPKRVLICCVYQDPVGFNVAVTRWLPRSDEWMVSVVRWKWGALGQKPDNFLQLSAGPFPRFRIRLTSRENCLVCETFFISPNS